ncbi:hypothetical protein glysoja_042478 [Glycine soja]|uniref:Uncharacterized protein n=1 Tax=Glycine soja TaxID=3848 RepID=A0A0B2QYZ5_GLYSO|nr:hypothetical protein glysoja_042478 [Glycine soja]
MAPTSFTGWLYDIDIYHHVISPLFTVHASESDSLSYHVPNHLIVIVRDFEVNNTHIICYYC